MNKSMWNLIMTLHYSNLYHSMSFESTWEDKRRTFVIIFSTDHTILPVCLLSFVNDDNELDYTLFNVNNLENEIHHINLHPKQIIVTNTDMYSQLRDMISDELYTVFSEYRESIKVSEDELPF